MKRRIDKNHEDKKRIDLHVHTNFSDGFNSPREVIEEAIRKGLDGIAIMDHDNIYGNRFARKILPRILKQMGVKDFIIIPGVEITTGEGDILAFGIDKTKSGTPKEVLRFIRKNNGVSAISHPCYGFGSRILATHFEDFKHDIDAIEVLNASVSEEGNLFGFGLARAFKKPGIAGSDAHFVKDIGTAYTIFYNVSCVDEIVGSIKKGKFKIGGFSTRVQSFIKKYELA